MRTFIPTLLWPLYNFLFKKNYVYVPSKSNKQKNLEKNIFFCLLWRWMTKIARPGGGSGSISRRHGSANLDPDQKVTDPQPQLCCDGKAFFCFFALCKMFLFFSLKFFCFYKDILWRCMSCNGNDFLRFSWGNDHTYKHITKFSEVTHIVHFTMYIWYIY